jgi:hypothetical protein
MLRQQDAHRKLTSSSSVALWIERWIGYQKDLGSIPGLEKRYVFLFVF